MSRYGEAMVGDTLLAEIKAEKEGRYEFRLYPQLWKSAELAEYYTGKTWEIVKFTDPAPTLPNVPGIYMFVVGPYCADLKDHSYIFYVGKTKNIRIRYRNYLAEKAGIGDNPRKGIMLLLNDFDGYLYFHFTRIPQAELQRAEELLKDNLTPVSNTQLKLIGRLTTT